MWGRVAVTSLHPFNGLESGAQGGERPAVRDRPRAQSGLTRAPASAEHGGCPRGGGPAAPPPRAGRAPPTGRRAPADPYPHPGRAPDPEPPQQAEPSRRQRSSCWRPLSGCGERLARGRGMGRRWLRAPPPETRLRGQSLARPRGGARTSLLRRKRPALSGLGRGKGTRGIWGASDRPAPVPTTGVCSCLGGGVGPRIGVQWRALCLLVLLSCLPVHGEKAQVLPETPKTLQDRPVSSVSFPLPWAPHSAAVTRAS